MWCNLINAIYQVTSKVNPNLIKAYLAAYDGAGARVHQGTYTT